LSFIYQSQGVSIYPQRQQIMRNQEIIQVRPKTFALLMLLLEKPGEVLSKSYLLERIWDDVKVEEQVLVQSVRELRQLFGSAGIIQTYPRKGYAWAADVEKQEACTATCAPQITPHTIAEKISPLWWRRSYALTTLVLALGLTICGLLYALRASSSAPQTDVVLVLPVKSQLPGNDYNWVPLGLMDQIIHLLISDNSTQVMPPEYVFQVMQFARLERNYDSEQVPRLFEVSGATLVVESQLTGFVENYRLDYKLRSKQDVKRGVLFDKDLSQLPRKLGEVIVSQTGQKMQNLEHKAQEAFHNELMARGVEKLDQKDYAAAQTLFKSLLQLEPDNLYARDHLIKSLSWGGNQTEAQREIDAAMTLARDKDPKLVARLRFYQSLVQIQQGNTDAALKSLDLADNEAKEADEILVQSSVATTRAQILHEMGKLADAQTNYEQALKFDGIIRCSIGMSNSHLKLAELLLKQGKPDQAKKHYQQAKELIESHQLEDMKPAMAAIKF
jgi:DNA-binding winged helix-turn-helix (wHTH) protein/tetratricopeptide (TPR) repeat protein